MVHEILGGLVEEGASCDFGAPSDSHEVAVQKGLHNAIHRDTAHSFHISAGDWLPVGDNSECLHGWSAESGLAVFREKLAQPGRIVAARHELPTGRAFPDFKGTARVGVFDFKFMDRLLNLRRLHLGEGCDVGILFCRLRCAFENGAEFLC